VSVESFERILAAHPFFADLDPGVLELLVGCASNTVFKAGSFLFREGQPADEFFVVRQGEVAVEIYRSVGGPLTVETVSGGEVLGWSWLFPPYKWHFDARAVSAVRALAFDAACLRRKLEADKAVGYEVLRRFASVAVQRLEATQLQLLDMYVERP
jgi:CRP/FNR family transcriptional regulator, cyclic AMP receptor protein